MLLLIMRRVLLEAKLAQQLVEDRAARPHRLGRINGERRGSQGRSYQNSCSRGSRQSSPIRAA